LFPRAFYAASTPQSRVNGDGKPDLLVAIRVGPVGNYEGAVGVLLGNGDGTFQQVADYDSGGGSAWWIALGDVNNDGKLDAVVANADSNSVGVLLGNGDGTFQLGVSYGSGGNVPRSVAIEDVNGDGNPDLLVTNYCEGSSFPCSGKGAVGVLLGNGDGTFRPVVTYDLAVAISPLASADVNGDGKPDLLVSVCNVINFFCVGNGAVGVLLGNGDGTFQGAVTYPSCGYGVGSVAVADVNGDAKPDLVMGSSATVCVLSGNGDGTFQPAVTYSLGQTANFVAIADVNGDGKPDLLVATGCCVSNGVVGVLLNNTPFDTNPPVITLSATPRVLWPPNEKMVSVTVSGTITDTDSGVNVKSAAYAVKDEYGEVQPKGALSLGPGGTYSFTLLLQASRLGIDMDGRRYTVTVSASDNAGNRGSKTSVVIVPHDRGN
jgi:FG-GAP-like repeat